MEAFFFFCLYFRHLPLLHSFPSHPPRLLFLIHIPSWRLAHFCQYFEFYVIYRENVRFIGGDAVRMSTIRL